MVYKGEIIGVEQHCFYCLMASREGEFLGDLECGGSTSEDEGSKEPVSSTSKGRKVLTRGRSGALFVCNGSVSSESDTDSSDGFPKSGTAGQRVELLIDRSSGSEECTDLVALLDKRSPTDQCKKPCSKKASKPPRPPKGPLLNAADLKLVRELSELAARKRARIERMRALRKMKEAKRTSGSSNSLTAMIITIIFFLIVILQGAFSRNVSKESQGSPAPAVASENLISIQLFDSAHTSETKGPISLSLNSLDRAYSSSPQAEGGRDTG